MKTKRFHSSLMPVAACLAAVIPALGQQQVVPPPAIPVTAPVVTLNNSPGDQTDPHVSGDLASYTDGADSTLHYYRFSTGLDTAIPVGAPGGIDALSGISGSRICFTRIESAGDQIAIFDTGTSSLTEVDPHQGVSRVGCAIGGNTLVYLDQSTNAAGDVYVYDLAANPPVAPQLLNGDTFPQQNPNVSEDGNVIVWEHCPAANNCDIMQAVRTGGVWAVSTTANSPDNESNPDSDDNWVTYDVNHGGVTGSDICWRPVAGGSETCLALPGHQINPSIK
jgi:hypothetical protein